jgi:hypothetical protein
MTMIERVARAIEAVNRTPESSAHTQRISTAEDDAERYRTLARAAIAAMKLPQGAWAWPHLSTVMVDDFNWVIDEALKGKLPQQHYPNREALGVMDDPEHATGEKI